MPPNTRETSAYSSCTEATIGPTTRMIDSPYLLQTAPPAAAAVANPSTAGIAGMTVDAIAATAAPAVAAASATRNTWAISG